MVKLDLVGQRSVRASCDGSFDAEAKVGGVGVRVVSDDPERRGDVVFDLSKMVPKCARSDEAEALAVAEALEQLQRFEGRVVIETDVTDLADALKDWSRSHGGVHRFLSGYPFLVEALVSWVSRPPSWKKVRSVARTPHRKAHKLAYRAMKKARRRKKAREG